MIDLIWLIDRVFWQRSWAELCPASGPLPPKNIYEKWAKLGKQAPTIYYQFCEAIGPCVVILQNKESIHFADRMWLIIHSFILSFFLSVLLFSFIYPFLSFCLLAVQFIITVHWRVLSMDNWLHSNDRVVEDDGGDCCLDLRGTPTRSRWNIVHTPCTWLHSALSYTAASICLLSYLKPSFHVAKFRFLVLADPNDLSVLSFVTLCIVAKRYIHQYGIWRSE